MLLLLGMWHLPEPVQIFENLTVPFLRKQFSYDSPDISCIHQPTMHAAGQARTGKCLLNADFIVD